MARADSTDTTKPSASSAPEKPQDALYLKTDATPEQIFQAIGRLRKEARDAIDELIGFLDKTDDYVSRELEDDGDQGDASYPEGSQRMCEHPMEDDEEDDPGEANGDDEPNLGSSATHASGTQAHWASGTRDDREDEHDGSEPSLCGIHVECKGGESDYEADLGSPDGIVDQRLTMLASGIPWSVADGEEDGTAAA